MAPKRSRKPNVGVEDVYKYNNIILDDVLCPICRSILVEPVTLPCNHGFCLSCFNSTMENNTLTCPLCRIRIGSWLRTAKKENKLVNNILWQSIQDKFANEIQKKKAGVDVTAVEKVAIRLSNPGEIRREYELQLAREQSEIEKQREAEDKASELIIKKILEEEKAVANIEAEKIRLDQEVAKRLASEIQSIPGPSNSDLHFKKQTKKVIDKTPKKTLDSFFINMNKMHNIDSIYNSHISSHKIVLEKSQTIQKLASKSHTSTILCQSRNVKNNSSTYKNLFFNKVIQREHNNSTGSDSGDSIKQEMRYFKPIKTVPKTLPKLVQYGISSTAPPLLKIPAKKYKMPTTICIQKPNNKTSLIDVRYENSAFAKYTMNTKNKIPITQLDIVPTKSVSSNIIVTETGKAVKQYYNKKLFNPNYIDLTTSQELSPLCSPVLGFEKPNKNHYNNVVSSLVRSISASLNISPKHNSLTDKNIHTQISNQSQNEIESQHKVSEDCSKQLEMDLEFARKLHKELNRPRRRETRSKINNNCIVAKNNLKKRQITLDEFVAPKKLKT